MGLSHKRGNITHQVKNMNRKLRYTLDQSLRILLRPKESTVSSKTNLLLNLNS